MGKQLPIRWDRLAKKHLDSIYNYIAKDSDIFHTNQHPSKINTDAEE